MSWHIYVTRYGDTDWFLVFLIFLTYDLSSKSLIGPKYFEIEGAPIFLVFLVFGHGVTNYLSGLQGLEP